jgi:hypothetical protein
MKIRNLTVLLLSVFIASAQADISENFSVNLNNTLGTVLGTVTGTVDLPFVNAGGSGSGAADSLLLTSIPAGFGALAGGNNVTNWADQVTNTFTVTAGAVTSFEFLAVTSPNTSVGDYFCINSDGGSAGSIGGWGCPGGLNELSETSATFGYNFGGASGVTFTPSASATPEPSFFIPILTMVLFLIAFVARKRIAPGRA